MRSIISLGVGLLTFPALAQNHIQHYSGTAFTSRGSAGISAVTLLQRLPADQVCGRTAIQSISHVIQNDGLGGGMANWSIDVRRNNPAGPPTGSPDMSSSGLIATLPISFNFPGGIAAFQLTVTPTTPIALPPSTLGPSGDIYISVALPSRGPIGGLHTSAESWTRANAVGYTGTLGLVGLAWDSVAGGSPNPSAIGRVVNPSWHITTRFVDEVLQPFQVRAGQAWFGYGGLFPDPAQGDQIGLRAVAQGTSWDVSVLLVSSTITAPIAIPGIGSLCLGSNAVPVAASLFTPLVPPSTVAATFGPYPTAAGIGDVYFQALSYKFGGGNRLSTACRVNM